MTQKSVDAILKKAANDANFRSELTAEPDKALASFRDQLSDEEIKGLKSVSPEVLNSISRMNDAGSSQKWYLPGSFKEFGGALVSIILLVLLLFVVWQTFSVMSGQAELAQSGESAQAIDTFEQSKDILGMFFPLFSAVVTFWLGASVEGRRADKNEAEANQARQGEKAAIQDQMQAETKATETKAKATANLAQVKAAVIEAQSASQSGSPGGVAAGYEGLGYESAVPGDSTPPAIDPFDSVLAAIDSAEKQLQ